MFRTYNLLYRMLNDELSLLFLTWNPTLPEPSEKFVTFVVTPFKLSVMVPETILTLVSVPVVMLLALRFVTVMTEASMVPAVNLVADRSLISALVI